MLTRLYAVFSFGDVKKAIATQKKALEHADPEWIEQLEPPLKEYEEALNKL